jgi:zinc protease
MPAQTPDTPEFYQKRFMPMRHDETDSSIAGPGAAAAARTGQTFERQLANGLRVIVKEDRRAPTVAHMVWYRAGSMDETNGRTGVAHVLEHMMFKGTPKVGPGEFNRRVAAAGGRDNAFTSRDYTAYFQQVPKHKLSEMMQLEADRMRHLTSTPAEFAQEIRVVMEERRLRTDDQPQSLLFEQLTAVAFQAHPYRVPVIGWMNDLENMTLPMRALVRQLVCAEQRLPWWSSVTSIIRRCSSLPSSTTVPAGAPLPVRKPQDEPPQARDSAADVKAPADLPVVMMAYKVPVIRDVEQDVDPYALEMLAAVLAGHDAARFRHPGASSVWREAGPATTRPHAVRASSTCTARPARESRPANSKPVACRNRAVQERAWRR